MKRLALAGGGLVLAALLAGGIGVALATAKTVAPAAASSPPKPMLWKVSDADNDIYLLGSFHALKPSDYPLAASVDAAFADAEIVAFEIAPAEMASPDLSVAMMTAASYAPGQTLKQALPEAEWLRFEAYARRSGVPVEALSRFEPWFLSMYITLAEMAKVGFKPEEGLDHKMMARAASAGKRTLGLETGADQIRVLDGMSADEQRQSLAEALDDAENFKARIDRLHSLWRSGDEAGLDATLVQKFKREYAQLYQRINVDRNQAWMPKLRKMLDAEPKDDTLVIVGAMHLVGSDGVVSQLRAKGYRVQRL